MNSNDHLLVSQTERDRAIDLLKELYAANTIDHFEFDTRIDAALRARTRADLNRVFDGVPIPRRPAAQRVPMAAPQAAVEYGDDRVRAGLTQWLGYPTSFVGPLIVANTAGKRSPQLRERALEAANFQLTLLGAMAIVGFLAHHMFGLVGMFFPLLGMAWFVLTGIAGLVVMAGGKFRYPFTARLLH